MTLPQNLTILPGVRQGVKRNGEYYLYQIGRYPSGKSVEVPYKTQQLSRPFKFRFLADEKGHLWEYPAYPSLEESKVHACGNPDCRVCSEKHGIDQSRVIRAQEEQ